MTFVFRHLGKQCGNYGYYTKKYPIWCLADNRNSLLRYSSSQIQKGFWDGLINKYGPESIEISNPDDYNRWKMVPLAMSTHLCLGACYAWSIFNEPLTRTLGVLSTSSQDWALGDVTLTFSGIIIGQGLAMASLGKWVDKVGPKIAGVIGGCFFGGGMMLGSLGISTHTIGILYLGYGGLAGIGMGLAYLPPITTLLKWFPDRPGLGSAMAICGFGGGAMLIAPLKKHLMSKNFEMPEYLGTIDNIVTKVDENGRRLTQINEKWKEVINVSSDELVKFGDNLQEGLYLVGSGNTGVQMSMATLGCGYLVVIALGASAVKLPKSGWLPKQMIENNNAKNNSENNNETNNIVSQVVHVDDVIKIPQFWLQFILFTSTATVGQGFLSQAKDILAASFASSSGAAGIISTLGGPSAFALTYVQILSCANLSGRFVWASLSDKTGQKNMFSMFTMVGAPLCLSLPYIISLSTNTTSVLPVYGFFISSFFIISFFGAGYSTLPAYENKLFGQKYVGAIHGRLMIASALAGFCGPSIFSKLRENERINAINELISKCDPNKFYDKFGLAVEKSQALIDSGALNIDNLLSICPDGTIDPTPHLYDPAFKTMACVFGIGAISNLMIRKVNPKWLLSNRLKQGIKYSDIK